MTPPGERLAVKSADRVLDLFELLAGRRQGLSHAEIAEALHIPKSSLSQLLATLQTRGYLAFSHEGRGWRLGDRLQRLATAQAGPADLAVLAVPVLEALTQASRESSALNLLDGADSVAAATVMGPMRLVSHMKRGDRAPLYATSGGKALLACMDGTALEAYLAGVRFAPLTPRTLASVAALRRELAAVRALGVAYSMEEFTPGIVGIAVPLRRPGQPALAAINVAMPAVRFDDATAQRVGTLLRDAAAQLLQRLDA